MPAPKTSSRFGYPKIALALLIAMAGIGWCGYLLIGRPVGHPSELLKASPDGSVFYEVPRNCNTATLARDLYAKGLIGFPNVFKVFVRFTGQAKRIRAGFYYLPPSNSVLEMAFKLTSGKWRYNPSPFPKARPVGKSFQF